MAFKSNHFAFHQIPVPYAQLYRLLRTSVNFPTLLIYVGSKTGSISPSTSTILIHVIRTTVSTYSVVVQCKTRFTLNETATVTKKSLQDREYYIDTIKQHVLRTSGCLSVRKLLLLGPLGQYQLNLAQSILWWMISCLFKWRGTPFLKRIYSNNELAKIH